MKQLIEVHSQELRNEFCSHCDGPSIETHKFYKAIEGNYFSAQTYLDCCKDKVGTIIDWYSIEDYQKIIGKYTIGGFSINQIAGYKK